jgi:hypothetical protein
VTPASAAVAAAAEILLATRASAAAVAAAAVAAEILLATPGSAAAAAVAAAATPLTPSERFAVTLALLLGGAPT